MRVELPAYSSPWLRGNKYGEVVKVARRYSPGSKLKYFDAAYVRLDDYNAVVRVVLEHCTVQR